jgi:hypothetical protein
MAIDVYLKLDDVGLFKKPRKHEVMSQYQRAGEVRDQFAECMSNALRHRHCVMPELCAYGHDPLSCVHLHVDYANFSGSGIPLTGKARKVIDARLRAIGTLVFREHADVTGPLPGDIHVPALARISAFTSPRKSSGARASTRATAREGRGAFGRLLGSIFG